jgi:hypothetical protein
MIQDRLAGGQKPDISKKSRSKVGQYGGSAFMFKFSFTASSFLSAKKDLPWDLNSMPAVTSGWFTLPALNFLEEKTSSSICFNNCTLADFWKQGENAEVD